MGLVLATPGFWVKKPETGVDFPRVLHGEQGLTIHPPLPLECRVIGQPRINEIIDKGVGRGALMYTTRDLLGAAGGDLLCSITNTTFLRGDGGFGGPIRQPHPVPEGTPDASFDWSLGRHAALLYRLNSDFNPVHADPKAAAQGGFAQPILHGVAARTVANLVCDGRPERLRRVDMRFTAPVYVGETPRTKVWRQGDGAVAFRMRLPRAGIQPKWPQQGSISRLRPLRGAAGGRPFSTLPRMPRVSAGSMTSS